MKFDIKTRGANTIEYWEAGHKKSTFEWNNVTKMDMWIENIQFYYMKIFDILKKENNVQSVLELGCGNAECLAYYARNLKNIKFTGIDFTDEAFRYNKKFDYSNMKFEKRDFLLDCPEKKYDIIMILETLEHVEEKTNYDLVNELLIHCKKLYITVPKGGNSGSGSNKGEHISFYDLDSFNCYDVLKKEIIDKKVYLFVLKGKL